MIKVLSTERGVSRFRVVTNMTRESGDGTRLFEKLLRVTDRFLDVTLTHAGSLPYDDRVWRSVQRQVPFVSAFPGALATAGIRRLAAAINTWEIPSVARGNIEFFMDRLLRTQSLQEKVVA